MSAGRIVSWIKARGWVVNLFFIMIGSYLVAGAANSVLARTIRVLPTVEEGAASRRSTAMRPIATSKVEYLAMATRNLFGALHENISPLPEVTVDPSDLAEHTPIDYTNLHPCTLANSLRGTLVAEGAPEWSLAVIYDNAKREAAIFSINEGANAIADDATLVEVRSREVIVRRRDRFERCLAEGEGGASSKPAEKTTRASAPRATGDSSADAIEHIRKTGENDWEIDREFLEKEILENLSKVATQARIVPSFKDGKPNGFKLFSIKPESFYSKIGLQNGDVIQRINGYEMNSPDKALEIYQKLRDATSVTVDFQRGGRDETKNVNILP